MSEFFQELKRRNVIRVALAYVMLGWIVAQVAELALDSFESPAWVMKTILLVLALGLPFAIFFAWAFEITPDGIKKEKDVDREQSITGHTGRRLDRSIIALLTAALIFVVVDRYILDQPSNEIDLAAASGASIAVLPFVNMSNDADQEYFSDGISEELLNMLAKIPQFRVSGRTSSFAFKGQNQDLREIGRDLGVDSILEGSVRKNAGRVRITAQLINVSDGFHLWSETYDRELTDIFAVQDDIASKVVEALEIELLGGATPFLASPSRIENIEAHNAYLQGLFFYNKSGSENLRNAVQYLQKAVSLAPDSALAWAGYSRALEGFGGQGDQDPTATLSLARQAADTALRLDPNLPEAQLAIAEIRYNLDWDWVGAETALARAFELRPNYLAAQTLRSDILVTFGDVDAAEKVIREALSRDPLDERLPRALLALLYYDNRLDEAIELGESLVQKDPGSPFARAWLSSTYIANGEPEKALPHAEREPVLFARLIAQAIAHHAAGNFDKAEAAQIELENAYGDLAAYQQALIFSKWGDVDTALDWLEKAYRQRDNGILEIKSDGALSPLHGHPRFEAILQKMNLAD